MDKKGEINVIQLIKPLNVKIDPRQIDILIALSDNEGYAKNELERMIGPKNLGKQLEELSSDNFGNLEDSLSIQYHHLKDPLSLAHKIQDQRDPVSKYIFKNGRIINWIIEDQNKYYISLFLANYLNETIIRDAKFFDRERFFNVKLSEEAKNLMAMKEELNRGTIRILNRILIQDTYPKEICKTRIPLIHRSLRLRTNKSRQPYFINPDLRTFDLIIEHLKNQIILDRNIVGTLNARLNINLAAYRGIEKECRNDSTFLKNFKIGNMDMVYYRNRYEDNINTLKKFMASNYVEELKTKYEYIDFSLSGLSQNEFDFIEFSIGEKRKVLR